MTGIFNGERPMNLTVGGIGGLFPSDKLQIEGPFIRETAAQALFGEDPQFDLGQIARGTMR